MAIICMYNTKRMYPARLVRTGVSAVMICNAPTLLGSRFRVRGGDVVGAALFLQTLHHEESCATFATRTSWAAVRRCRPQGPDPSPGHGAHAWSNKGKAGGRLAPASPRPGAAVGARIQGFVTARVATCHWCHARDTPQLSQPVC